MNNSRVTTYLESSTTAPKCVIATELRVSHAESAIEKNQAHSLLGDYKGCHNHEEKEMEFKKDFFSYAA